MEPRRLGQSELFVTPVLLGTMARGRGEHDDPLRLDIVRAALDAGITSIDTAPLYELGRSETLVGRAVAGQRGSVQLLTKVGLRWGEEYDGYGEVQFQFDDGGRRRSMHRDSRPASIRWEVEQSLRRLNVEVLDLVQVHRWDQLTPIADTMGALLDLRREGKLREIGVSTFPPVQLREAVRALGGVPLASHQVEYSLLARDCEREQLPVAREHGVGTLAFAPLAAGALAGRLGTLDADDPRRMAPAFHAANEARMRAAFDSVVAPIAERHGTSAGNVCMAWVLAQPGVDGVVVGASSVDQVRDNALAGDLSLDANELNGLQAAFQGLRYGESAAPLAMRVLGRARRFAGRLTRRLR